MKSLTPILIIGALAYLYFKSGMGSASWSAGQPVLNAMGQPLAPTQQQQYQQITALQQQVAQSNPSAATQLSFAASDIQYPGHIVAGTVYPVLTLMGLAGGYV